jgi:hypothetical protein
MHADVMYLLQDGSRQGNWNEGTYTIVCNVNITNTFYGRSFFGLQVSPPADFDMSLCSMWANKKF